MSAMVSNRGYVSDEEEEGLYETIGSLRDAETTLTVKEPSRKEKKKKGSECVTEKTLDEGRGVFTGKLAKGDEFYKFEKQYRKHVKGRDDAPKNSALKSAYALEAEIDEQNLAKILFDDPNVKFMGWVAGYCGSIEIKKFMIGRAKGGDMPLRFSDMLLGGGGKKVEWGEGEKRIDHTGHFLLTDVFVAARDDAFDKIKNLTHNRRAWCSEKMTMQEMIEEPKLNRIFAKLTACIWRELMMQKPTRYVSERQSQRLTMDERTVKLELLRYFKNDNRSCGKRGRDSALNDIL